MTSSEDIHKMFTSDPIHFKSLVNNLVEVETKGGPLSTGILFTIDPVSETVVLLTQTGESLKVNLIPSHNVKNIKVVEATNVAKIPDNLFKEDWAKHMSEEEIEKKRHALKDWLTKNTIPIVESDKLLKLEDVLTIEPPYGPDQCSSNNEIVLSKIQELIKSMPV
ncbi:gem-associated protein 6-like [Macrosteles quadrilineatus]|uniref:gem-associated protein 6-like n=1 Tax=Macrosteles quadrilineatus TaxID=74068 RepID=UPI0023E23CAB|nr:gem-associated protein 6-like [Macrosteles quadrilineatus]